MPTEHSSRRALWTLVTIAVGVIAIVALVAGLVMAHHNNKKHVSPTPHPPTAAPPVDEWNTVVENELASRPMLALPPQDAQPRSLTTATAGPVLRLPQGFTDSPLGALAQLKALDESALVGGDPDVYAHDYRKLSLPGAPDPGSTGLASVLISFRASGGLPDSGLSAGLSVTYQVVEGLIKGSADDGRYVVACVLGELTVQDRGQMVAAGVGDCQALRWTGAGWRISPGAMAAAAPCAWPGSAESVQAGYRELS